MIELENLNNTDIDFILKNWVGTDVLPGYSFSHSREEISKLINTWNQKIYHDNYFEMFIIKLDSINTGLLSLYQHNNNLSVGISIHPNFQKQGIASKAIKIIERKAKNDGWKNLLSQCRVDNLPSVKLHKKCGFTLINKIINSKKHEAFIWKIQLN